MASLQIPLNIVSTRCNIITSSSQIYRLHGLIPNLCEICYFVGLYYLNMNVVHYLSMEVMCMTLMFKQYKYMNDICVCSIQTYEKEILHNNYCQIVTHEVCDDVSFQTFVILGLMNFCFICIFGKCRFYVLIIFKFFRLKKLL
jgi:hypothetical protein